MWFPHNGFIVQRLTAAVTVVQSLRHRKSAVRGRRRRPARSDTRRAAMVNEPGRTTGVPRRIELLWLATRGNRRGRHDERLVRPRRHTSARRRRRRALPHG